MERSKESYYLTRQHLRRVAAGCAGGFHQVGIGSEFRRFDLSAGGDVTVVGLWDE